MADHRIGIGVDVRDNGTDRLKRSFEGIAQSTRDLEDQFKQMDRSISDLVERGWGSEKYTRQLKEQLRTMQDMANLQERQARISGNEEARQANAGMRQRARDMAGDLGAVQTRGGGGLGGLFSGGMSTAGRWAGRMALAYAGYQSFRAVQQGYNDAKSQNFALADIAKTMAPGGGSESWAYQMLGSGQGFAYSNPQIIQAAQIIKNAAGNNPQFMQQIHGVAQFGRQYGFDFSQAANYFGSTYQTGVTGGTGAQMSWQQYAILVANTVQQANMQGREGQVVETLQQLTSQLSSQNMSAPNQQAMAGLYATAARTGNQNLINNYGSMMGAVNAGIMSPGMGPMGQAAMWQAVAPGKNYWDAMMQMSQGNTPQNFQNMLTYAYNTFGGDTNQAAMMLSQWIPGLTGPQAKTLLDTYMKNGKFQSTTPSKTTPPKNQTPNMSQMDNTNNNFVTADQGKQGLGSDFLGVMGDIANFLWGTPTRAAITTAAAPAATYVAKNATKKVAQKVAQKIATRAGTTLAEDAAGDVATTGAADAGGSLLLDPLTALPAIGLGAIWWAGNGPSNPTQQKKVDAYSGYLQRQQAYFNAHPDYYQQWMNQAASDPFHIHSKGPMAADDPNAPWNKGLPRFAHGGVVNRPTIALVGEQGPERITPVGSGYNAQESAKEVVATILALRPWAGTLRSALATPGSASAASAAGTASASSVSLSDQLASQWQTGGAKLPNVPGLPSNTTYFDPNAPLPTNQYTGKSQQAFIRQMGPYAMQAAKKAGIPAQYQSNFAEFALSQWALESNWGNSTAAGQNDNFGGIKPWGNYGAGRDTTYAGYSSLSDWANGYAAFLTQNPNYSQVISAAKNGANPTELVNQMAQTPYAEDPNYGAGLYSRLGQVNSAMQQMKIKLDMPKTIKVQITDTSGNVVGTTMVPLTANATWNGLKNTPSMR